MKKYLILLSIVAMTGIGIVSAQAPAQDPIVIIPGIGGAMNADIIFDPTPTASIEGWDFTPSISQYDQLIQSFLDAGLVENQDFFVAFYDWRQSNADSAVEYLVPIINIALTHSETGKVDIVAHSMGGLLARSYIQSNSYQNNIDQLIMMGTPNYGSSDVYTLWEGGVVPDSWGIVQKSVLDGFLWYMKWRTTETSDGYDTIHQYVPSVQELLPTYDYIVDKDSGDVIPIDTMNERNLFLGALNLEGNKTKLVENVSGGVSIIAGEGESTVGKIPVVPHAASDGKFWVDGKPDPLSPVRNDQGGDNRVLLSSAFLDVEPGPPGQEVLDTRDETLLAKIFNLFTSTANAQFFPPPGPQINTQVISSKHGDLPTDSIPEIFSILGMDAPTLAYEPIPEPDEILTFWFASPIEVQITSPSGAVTTKTINGIPGSTYDGATDPLGFKMVVIENPELGEYIVELLGLATGGYHMGVGSFSDSGDSDATVEGSVTPGKRLGYSVAYSGDASVNISDPFDIGEENLFEKFRNIFEELRTYPHIKKMLVRQADRAEKLYDKGKARQLKMTLQRMEMMVNIFRGWIIPHDTANELIAILKEIRELPKK